MHSNGVQRIEAGQVAVVLAHTEGEWQNHVGWSFEQAPREHAIHLVGTGGLPAAAQVDEWWSTRGPQVQLGVPM